MNQITRRLPEAGRIRIGVKTERAIKAIDTFRFTSHDQTALEQVAALYGGQVRPWKDAKAAPGQFEVITQASEIRVVLPPDPLGGTPIYEKWSGGGCERRCDGITCTQIVKGPDGPEPVDVDCLCSAAGRFDCDPKTRLNVMLAGVRFGGTWRLESKSWNVAQEMPGMVDLIATLQDRGLTRGVLALKQRRSVQAGETHQFIVPVLGIDESLEQIALGAAQVGALPSATVPELEVGANPDSPQVEPPALTLADGVAPTSAHDQIIDAELVPDDGLAQMLDPGEAPTQAQVKLLAKQARELCLVGSLRHEWATRILGRDVTTFGDLTKHETSTLIKESAPDGEQ